MRRRCSLASNRSVLLVGYCQALRCLYQGTKRRLQVNSRKYLTAMRASVIIHAGNYSSATLFSFPVPNWIRQATGSGPLWWPILDCVMKMVLSKWLMCRNHIDHKHFVFPESVWQCFPGSPTLHVPPSGQLCSVHTPQSAFTCPPLNGHASLIALKGPIQAFWTSGCDFPSSLYSSLQSAGAFASEVNAAP